MIMLLQWLLEARKWQVMLSPGYPIKLPEAFRMILSGIALSIATPNRMGEFAGRVMHLPSGQRLQGSALTVIGNFAQLIVTCIAGSIALCMEWQDQHLYPTGTGVQAVQTLLLWTTPLTIIFFMLLYFKAGLVFNWILSLRMLGKFRDKLGVLATIPNNILLKVLLLSSLRFVFFILQYWLLFKLTNTGICSHLHHAIVACHCAYFFFFRIGAALGICLVADGVTDRECTGNSCFDNRRLADQPDVARSRWCHWIAFLPIQVKIYNHLFKKTLFLWSFTEQNPTANGFIFAVCYVFIK